MSELTGGSTVAGHRIWHAGNLDPAAIAASAAAKDYNVTASVPDNNGIYTVVEYRRADGTLHARSTLSGLTNDNYTVVTIQFYDAAGTSIVGTNIWDMAFDSSGIIISKIKR